MNALTMEELQLVEFKLNGRAVHAAAGETILQAARRAGVEIPHLCYTDSLQPAGNCRACVVEIKGERVLAPSCCRAPTAGMEVSSDNARAVHSQKMVLELLKSDMPERSYTTASELDHWAARLGVEKPRFAPRLSPGADLSHPAMAVNLDACIQCTRCVRGLPRRAGQRRDRLRVPRSARQDRVRPR
jgi:formate dehydrogenase major subunit